MQFLRMLFTWWHSQTLGTALTTWRHGELVGMDEQGNRYYRDKNGKSINGKTRRWVVYNGDVEAHACPRMAWLAALHGDETPEEAGFEKKTGTAASRKPDGHAQCTRPAGQEDAASHRAGYGSGRRNRPPSVPAQEKRK